MLKKVIFGTMLAYSIEYYFHNFMMPYESPIKKIYEVKINGRTQLPDNINYLFWGYITKYKVAKNLYDQGVYNNKDCKLISYSVIVKGLFFPKVVAILKNKSVIIYTYSLSGRE